MNYLNLSNFGTNWKSWLIAFLWGLFEGLFFFIIPDIYLSFIALFSFRGGIVCLGFTLLGSLVSATIIFSLSPFVGDFFHKILLIIPGVSDSMINTVSIGLQNHGVRSLVEGPLSGIPYKIYSVEAAIQHLPFFQYILWSIPARLERMLPVTILTFILGYFFRKNIEKNVKFWVAGFIILWIFIYIKYFLSL